ncbi:MAG: leucine-rich repeat domain-containing protein [Clostridiaceae bacterium]
MKKTLCILLAVLMALSLFACAAKPTEPAAEATEEITEEAAAEPTAVPAEEAAAEAAPTVDPNMVIAFNDDVLEGLVRTAMNKPEGDILVSDALAMTELSLEIDCGDWSIERIHDLSALKYFTNLTQLSIFWSVQNGEYYDNDVDISALAGMTKMKSLQIRSISISDISALGNMKDLERLLLTGTNRLNDLSPLANCKKLLTVDMPGNAITDISVLAGLTELQEVILNDNYVSDVTPLAGLTHLTMLHLSDNPIKDYSSLAGIRAGLTDCDFEPDSGPQPIAFNDALLEQKIRTALNKPEGDITIADTEAVTELWIGNEWQQEIPEDQQIRDTSALKYFPNLTKLNVQNCGINRIDELRVMKNLGEAMLDNNNIRDIRPLLACKNLYYLSMNNNEFTSADLAPLSEMTGLKYIDISYSNNVSDVTMLSGLTDLDALYMQGIHADLSPLVGLKNLTKLYLPEPFEDKYTPDYSIFKDIYPNLTDKNFELPQE